jgi:flagellar export protein FliJ
VAYRFTLDVLLRLQRSLEIQQEQRLVSIVGEIASLENQIEMLDANCQLRKRDVLSRIEKGGSIAELHFVIAADEFSIRKRNELLEELKRAEEQKKEQAELYRMSHQRTETLASLDAQQRNEYNVLASRRDQQLSDEAFLMRKRFEAAD